MTCVSPRDYLTLRGLPLDRDFAEHLPDETARYLGFAMDVAARFCKEEPLDGVTDRLDAYRDAGRMLRDPYSMFGAGSPPSPERFPSNNSDSR